MLAILTYLEAQRSFYDVDSWCNHDERDVIRDGRVTSRLTRHELHLDEKGVFVEEVVVVGHNVCMVQHRQDVGLVQCVGATSLAQSSQVHFLPNH